MKSLFIFLLFPSLLSAQIEFFKGSWEEALEASEKSGKLIFVDFYTTWCQPCKKLEQEVFSKPEVAEFMNTSFINFKADADGDGRPITSKYNVNSYPRMVFVRHDETYFDEIKGAVPMDEFMERTKEVFYKTAPGMPVKAFEETWKTQPHTPEMAFHYFHYLKMAGLDCSPILERFLSELHPDSLELPHYERILLLYTTRTDGFAFQIILKKQSKATRFANKVNVLLEIQCKKACTTGNENLLRGLLKSTEKAYENHPYKLSLRLVQYAGRFYLENDGEEKYVNIVERFISDQFIPLLQSSTAQQRDSIIWQDYVSELNNIAWQYSTYVQNKDALINAATWLELSNQFLGESVERLYYSALLRNKSGEIKSATALLHRAIELGKTQSKEVASMENLLHQWE